VDRKRGVRYKQKFRCQIVERMNACENIQRLSRELGIHRRLLCKWRDQVDPADAEAERDVVLRNTQESALRKENAKLKRLLADKTVEVDFFRSALQKVRARRQQSDISGQQASTMKSKTLLQGSLSIERIVSVGAGEPRGILSLSAGADACRGKHDRSICHSGNCLGTSTTVWLSTGHGGTAASNVWIQS
jgi:Transposase